MSDAEIEYAHENESGEEVTLFVSVQFDSYTEHNHGADADGNRGITSTFLEPEDIKIKLESGLDITAMIKKDDPALFQKLEDLVLAEADNELIRNQS